MKPLLDPSHIAPAPDPVGEFAPLLAEPLASAWAAAASPRGDTAAPAALRARLLQRTAASRTASAAMVTRRHERLPAVEPAPGVRLRVLYAHDPAQPLRPGEPLRSSLVELAPGATWAGPADDAQREWLVLQGAVQVGDEPLAERDYHLDPAGRAHGVVTSVQGAWLFLRESPAAGAAAAPLTVRDAEAGWPAYAPGIHRRVLWQHGGQASLLYLAEAGASVPHHGHGHDEECLMVQGELFLDDVLLQPGDYQLAPAGTGHHVTETDTGVVIYAHGDLDLQFVG